MFTETFYQPTCVKASIEDHVPAFGDHDSSGVTLFESMAEGLDAFAADEGLDGLIEMRRVALTPEQIQSLEIATKPDEVKPSDSRSRSFIERDLEPAAQLEAIRPTR